MDKKKQAEWTIKEAELRKSGAPESYISEYKKTFFKEVCTHEQNIEYIDLVQMDGVPFYTVKCQDCGEYGKIELEEGQNTFGMSEYEIKDFTSKALK